MKTKKILLVIDVQNDFIDGALFNEVAQTRISNIVKKINDFDGEYIFVTKDTHYDNYMETSEGINLPVPHCIKGTSGWELNKEIKAAIEAKKTVLTTIEKPTFGSWELVSVIRTMVESYNDEIEIEMVGFCTDICVLSNAIMIKTALFDKTNVKLIVDSNCCAGVTPEKHEAALEVMKSCQINVI